MCSICHNPRCSHARKRNPFMVGDNKCVSYMDELKAKIKRQEYEGNRSHHMSITESVKAIRGTVNV